MKARIGFTLQPEVAYLELVEPLFELVDTFEISPETTWRPDGRGGLMPNGFHELFRATKARTGKPFVAHGVGFSLGSVRPDAARRARWLERVRADHAVFEFLWYSDHFGASELAGREVTLPVALPMVEASAAAVRASLAAMQSVVPDVGFENSVFYFHLGDPLDEPAFLSRCLTAPRTHLLLDLHNVFTVAMNGGFDPWAYIERLPLERVIEIHVSGGAESDAKWLPSRRVMRLDSHDDRVPEPVWALFERVLPLCANLRGVTLERMEGTVAAEHVSELREELTRTRRMLEIARG